MAPFFLDYCARQKLGGTSLKYFTFKQLPVLPPETFDAECCTPWPLYYLGGIAPAVLELAYTSHEMAGFARDFGYDGPPFRWDPARRFMLRCELDAAFFHLYLLVNQSGDWQQAGSETAEEFATLTDLFPTPRDAVSYILDTFPIVRRKEEAAYGEFRTKRVVLEIYDAMTEAIRTGIPYQTRLDPPPADPRVAHAPHTAVAPAALLPIPTWAQVADSEWAAPPNIPPDNFVYLALNEVLHRIGANADPRDVGRAVQLVRTPAMAVPFLTAAEARQWIRIVGTEAVPAASNVIDIGQFLQRDVDLLWGETVAKFKGRRMLVEQDGKWSLGPVIMAPDEQGWLAGRADAAVWLARKLAEDEPSVEPKLTAYLTGVKHGKTATSVS